MIQRIQTIFLLLTTIVTALLFFMPVALIFTPDGSSYEFYTAKVIQISEPPVFIAYNWMSMILNITTTALSFLLIFLFKKRLLQLRLCLVNIIFMLGMLILMWVQLHNMTGELNADKQFSLGFCFPLIGIILTWLALRSIIRDVNLLKSFDRIR